MKPISTLLLGCGDYPGYFVCLFLMSAGIHSSLKPSGQPASFFFILVVVGGFRSCGFDLISD